jgi:hypothetical protein
VSGIASCHHVLGVEHLLGQLRHSQGSVLLAASGGQGSEAGHEEVEAGEGDHVDGQLPEISVQLAGEAEAGGDSRHGQGDQMVEISVGGSGELEGAEADVVQGLVVNAEGLVCVLNQLVDGKGCVVRLDNGVGDLGRGNDRVGVHDPVWVLLADFGDEESSHAGAGTSSEGVGHLEALEAVARFGLLADHVQD